MKKLTFWLNRFIIAYGIIMLGTFFMCLIFNPQSQLPVVQFFSRCIILTLVCMASLAVYYSKGELSLRMWWIRTVLHAVLLLALLLPLAHHWGFWVGRKDGLIYSAFILSAKVIWHLADYGRSIRAAEEVNEELMKRRKQMEEGN